MLTYPLLGLIDHDGTRSQVRGQCLLAQFLFHGNILQCVFNKRPLTSLGSFFSLLLQIRPSCCGIIGIIQEIVCRRPIELSMLLMFACLCRSDLFTQQATVRIVDLVTSESFLYLLLLLQRLIIGNTKINKQKIIKYIYSNQ